MADLNEVLLEGQKLTLEWEGLKRKEITNELSGEEKGRLKFLDGYLLGLVGQARAMGFNPTVGMGLDTPDEYGSTDNDW